MIGGFLFYKSRLYNLLLKIYQKKEKKEIRQANQSLLIQNKKLLAQLAEAQNDTTLNIDLSEQDPDNTILQLDGDHHQQLSALGVAYQTVKAMLDENPHMDEAQSQHLNERIAKILNIPINKEQDVVIRELQGQIDFLKQENLLIETKNQKIEQLEAQISRLKSIDAAAIEKAKAPKQGDFADEIYKLKCEKFDMLENINRLKMDIDRLSGTPEGDELLSTLQEQVIEQNNYIKQSDVVVSLLEKELEAANILITELEASGNADENNSNSENNDKDIKAIHALQKAQRETLSELKEKLSQTEETTSDELHLTQKKDIETIEKNIEDTERCVESLKSELQNARDRIKILESQLEASYEVNKKTKENSTGDDEQLANQNKNDRSESDEELEELLRKLINDSQEMLTTIADLEDENLKLKEQLA
ncbi:hypothetical protein [Marinicellulosiphila megalodicopiae]|uniref:hypothetical protein n=1 Tax=Marinicellulosiphila megalodicopiae TaxID=2724896 RepID=UPI003BAF5B40